MQKSMVLVLVVANTGGGVTIAIWLLLDNDLVRWPLSIQVSWNR
jgi:hypothetical protein